MRRFTIGFTVVVLVLLFASVAGAVPPDPCEKDLNHPLCTDPPPSTTTTAPPSTTTTQPDLPPGGTMCDPDEYPKNPDGTFQIEGIQETDFTFTLTGKKPGTCIDVLTTIAGGWEVTVTGEGARYLGLIPRDSIGPGDSCGGYLLRNAANIYGSSPHILGYEGSVPAATINACGAEWAEWVDVALPGLDPEVDCVANEGDQCLVADQIGVAHPLVLQVFMQSGGGSTTFHVDLPPLDPDWPDPDSP